MHLFKNRLGTYYARGTDANGRTISRSLRTKNKVEARRLKRDLEEALRTQPAVEELTLSELQERALTQRYATAPAKTVEWIRLGLENFRAIVGDVRLSAVTYETIDRFKVERVKAVSPVTLNRNLQAVRATLRWARKREWVQVVPEFELLPTPRLKPRWLSKEEIAALLRDVEGTRMERFITVMLYAGLRPGEALRLKWGEVHLNSPQPFLLVRMPAKHDRQSGAIKDQEERTIPLHPALGRLLMKWTSPPHWGQQTADSRVAAVSAMTVRRFFRKRWPDGSVTPHKLRHTFASHFAMDTQDLGSLQRILGHSDIRVTMDNYAHLALAHQATQMARMDLTPKSSQVSLDVSPNDSSPHQRKEATA